MIFVRSLSVLLVSLAITACDPGPGSDDGGGPEPACPEIGNPLLPELPRVLPIYTDGCEDSTWASEVEAEVAWTIELERGSNTSSMVVVPSAEGAVAISGRRAAWVNGVGEVTSVRDLGSAPSWNRVQGSLDGRLVLTGSSGAAPFYRVLDDRGAQLWLRLLDPNFGAPTLVLDGGDVLLGTLVFDVDVMLRIERWGLTGSKKGELTLAAGSDSFVRDGAGNYGVMANSISTVSVFDSAGASLGVVEVGIPNSESYVVQIVGAETGFYVAGGGLDPFVSKVSVADGQGEVDWTYTLGDAEGSWEFVNALAVGPDGGVVVVGGETKIRVVWPMSLLTNSMQPFVLALDVEGQPTWGERIGVPGQALAVGVGAAGEVYVGGTAQATPPGEYGGSISATWLRRYEGV